MNQVDEDVSMTVRLIVNEFTRSKVVSYIEGNLVELANNKKVNLYQKNQSLSIISNDGQLQSVIKLQVIYEPLATENDTTTSEITTDTHLIFYPPSTNMFNTHDTICLETLVCHPAHLKPHFQAFVFHSCHSCERLVPTGKLNEHGCCQREQCNQYVVVYRKKQYNASYCFDTRMSVLHDFYGNNLCYSCGKSGLHVSKQSVNFLTCD